MHLHLPVPTENFGIVLECILRHEHKNLENNVTPAMC